jgi:hypothetical protein
MGWIFRIPDLGCGRKALPDHGSSGGKGTGSVIEVLVIVYLFICRTEAAESWKLLNLLIRITTYH